MQPDESTPATFDGGAKRSGQLPPLEDIPYEFLLEMAERFRIGEGKYGRFNWKNGGPEFFRQAISHAIRHLYLYANGIKTPEEDDVQNLAAAGWGIAILMWWEKTGKKQWETNRETARDTITATLPDRIKLIN